MRSSSDFDSFYQAPDPWGIETATRRDKALATVIGPFVEGRSALELGCGEGHLTATVFRKARSVKGIDISPLAISRATSRFIPNASFQVADFLDVSFADYDVIAAIECLYYLSPAEQEAFYRKMVSEHPGKIFILSGPIIGTNEHRTYFTHAGIEQTFARHGLSLIKWRNLNANRNAGAVATIAAAASRLPLRNKVLEMLPEKFVNQRCYVAQCPTRTNAL
ncbi:class I SAM-dependent methyltransferase [Bradyrhizobium canariense]|uniref:Methyltransferase domain-containing protein n=1 Tax=Bradyrhizobium canariense TaxID=255045 RepID=A0A1H1UXR1_9BRAD|nr:class I SAM-dependent methyltransferase [Bradyrhizobium canariense]SDS77322.1 Methyltransferase domain-containing protein [Bradyrhizobium canariense]